MKTQSKHTPERTRTTRRTTRTKQSANVLRTLGPVAVTWGIAKGLYGRRRAGRGEILAACKEVGINPATASSEIQRFLHMQRAMTHQRH